MKSNKLSDVGVLVLRVVLALVILYYGSQKMLGTSGGAGLSGTLSAFKKDHFPEWLTMLAIISEFCGGIAVLIGLFTRLAAFGIACTMAVASWSNYSGAHEIKAAHLPLALFGLAAGLIFLGSGAYSLDAVLFKNRGKPKQGGPKP